MPLMNTLNLTPFFIPSIVAARKRFVAYSMQQLKARLDLDDEKASARHDFCHYMRNARDDSLSFAPAEMKGECVLLYVYPRSQSRAAPPRPVS